ncbi:non-hydrolyzing UDP-N-acetylglucosamine 2-epimerase [Demequina sediminicola]|uniref:non-hydrolyzing UDP-N-acetylglucosamine 2-epimerase n=1 Tax=Demequina sediminicola TaxID=1095026 RepID=UPI00078202A8|nr:UDP-N-acetylglucosamine 2-epimerase (non-hydrolyzing) [Demequina sediminicola]
MKVISVVGARPQFVKLAPVAQAMDEAGVEHIIVHTGQHYDADMSDVFFDGLSIPTPDVHLGVGSGSHATQTGAMLAQLEPVFQEHQPDWVLVYGDTNSTLAAALAAVKIHIPVAHLEAGLRSFNRRMPEEHNRVMTDHCSDLLLAPTDVAREHLTTEGLAERTEVVGDVMVDVCFTVRDAVLAKGAVDEGEPYLLSTIHRAENTDDPERLRTIIDALADAPVPVRLLAHPRLRAKAEEFGIALDRGSIDVRTPVPYAEMVTSVLGSVGVVTDSGGLQKEAYLLDRPCTTLRTETEWVETLHDGWNVLVADPADLASALARPRPTAPRQAPYGDGHAAVAAVQALAAHRAGA